MTLSLEELHRTEPAVLDLGLHELAAARHLDRNRILRIEVPAGTLAAEPGVAEALARDGFLRAPAYTSQILDLKAFAEYDAFIAAMPHRKRRAILQAAKRARGQCDRCEVSSVAAADPTHLAMFHEEIVMKTVSARGLLDYPPFTARGFLTVASAVTQLLTLWSGTRMVGGAVFVVRSVPNTVAVFGASLENRPGTRWVFPGGDLAQSDRVLDVLLSWTSAEFGGDLNYVLYSHLVRYCFEQGIEHFSGGLDDAFYTGPYLGVLAFKQHWGTRTALFWNDETASYLRLNPPTVFATRTSALQACLTKDDGPYLRLVSGTAFSESYTLRVLMGSDPDLAKELVVATASETAAASRSFASEAGLTVRTWAMDHPC